MIIENTPSLETERLILRKFEEKDIEDIFLIYGDEQVNKFLPWFTLTTKQQAFEYLHGKILPRYTQKADYCYAIVLKSEDRVIGYVNVSNVDTSADLGYAIRREYWHKGFAFEACVAVCAKIKAAGYPFITATHDINNPNSGAVMKKLKMKYCYSYKELWQPKNIQVIFRMYQLNFDENAPVYTEYQKKYPYFIEQIEL